MIFDIIIGFGVLMFYVFWGMVIYGFFLDITKKKGDK
jgi:hypothetical protein